MARIARKYIKAKDEVAFYHVISHAVWEAGRIFSPSEKEFFLRLLRNLTHGYLVEIVAYALMDNHFHLLVKVNPANLLSEEEILERAKKLHPKALVLSKDIEYWREKLSDLSAFVKDLKQRFTQWYNRTMGRRGHLWEGRFKSIRVEGGRAALAVAAYIDLNPVRAGMTKSIDGYHFTSYSERRAFRGQWLMPITELGDWMTIKEYGRFLEEVGKIEIDGKGKIEEPQKGLVLHILCYRAEGIAYGSEEFLRRIISKLPWKRIIKKREIGFLTVQ